MSRSATISTLGILLFIAAAAYQVEIARDLIARGAPVGTWTTVHVGKWSSWSLLAVMTFTIVANLNHIKERVHVPA